MKIKPNPVAEFLGTANTKEQINILQGLKLAATAPIIDIIVRFDPRVGQIGLSIIGGDLPYDVARKILQGALDQLHEKELETAIGQSQEKGPEAILSLPKAQEVQQEIDV